jgi:hypothetical protein
MSSFCCSRDERARRGQRSTSSARTRRSRTWRPERRTSIVDVGPDIYSFDRTTGNLIVAITGRSLTGSGVIGRVVIDTVTGEVISSAGNPQGDWVENACAALT